MWHSFLVVLIEKYDSNNDDELNHKCMLMSWPSQSNADLIIAAVLAWQTPKY